MKIAESNSVKVIEFNPKNNREQRLELSLQQWLPNAISIDTIHDKLMEKLKVDDENLVYGFKPSYFYETDIEWFWMRLYHLDRKNLDRQRVVLTLCLSGMEGKIPPEDFCKSKSSTNHK